MNAFALRGVEGVGFGRVMRKPRLSKRPRTFVAALIGTWVAFMWLVNRYAMLAQREHALAAFFSTYSGVALSESDLVRNLVLGHISYISPISPVYLPYISRHLPGEATVLALKPPNLVALDAPPPPPPPQQQQPQPPPEQSG